MQEDPTPVLFAQRKAARSELIGNLKADGVDYNERMALADEVTWPMPLAQLLEPALETYAQSNPWVRSHTLSPKSIVREMIETASTFTEFVSRYGLQRSEGVLLRYLTDTYRALRQIVPISARDEEVDAIMAWLNTLVRSIDSSLLDEWEALADGHLSASELGMIGAESDERNTADEQADGQEVAFGADADGHLTFTRNKHALRTAIRNELFTIVQRLERDDLETLSEQYAADGWTLTRWDDAAAQYWDQYDYLGVDTAARSAEFFSILEDPSLADLIQAGARPAMAAALLETHASGRIWLVTQVLDDGEGDYSWALQAFADLDASDAADALVIHLLTFAER